MASRGRRVLIPKGTLSPGKNNVIEIPQSNTSNIIVATKPKGGDSDDCDEDCPAAGENSSPNQSSDKQGGSRSKGSRRTPALAVSGSHSVTTVGPDIGELEQREKKNFKDDLREFQEARQKLFADVVTLQIAKEFKNKKKL